MITVDQIRIKIRELLAGELSFDSLDEWISAYSWNMQHDSSPEAISLLGKIELGLAEYDGGHLSEADLLKQIRAFVAFEFSFKSFIDTGSDSKTETFSFQSASREASDRSLEMVFSSTLLRAS